MRRVLSRFGYKLLKIPGLNEAVRDDSQGYTLYKYVDEDGTFDYELYRKAQTEGNRQKIENVWALEENIAFLAEYLKSHLGSPEFGICHGTRRGREQAWFRKYLNCEVIGTEISETATDFPHTIQWDFHEVRPEWKDSVDFIYSNSFDHSYDPEKCLNAWVSCLKPAGLCIIEHGTTHGPEGASALDPFGAHLVQMPYLITKWSNGKYCLRELLEAPRRRAAASHELHFLIVQRLPLSS